MFMSQFNLRHSIDNKQARPIQVRLKGGLEYTVPACKEDNYSKTVSLRVRMEGVDLRNFTVKPSQALTVIDKVILERIAESIERTEIQQRTPEIHILNQVVDVIIYLNDSHIEKNGAIHSELLGMTLYAGSFERPVHALNTPVNNLSEMRKAADKSNSVNLGIKLVDPESRFNQLWTNVLGKATPITAVDDISLQPGLYIVNEGVNVETTNVYYQLNDLTDKTLKALGIFLTEKEAAANSNTEVLIKLEEQLKNEIKENRNYEKYFDKQVETVKRLEDQLHSQTAETSHLKRIGTMRDLYHKSELAILKSKNSADEFGGLIKNVSSIFGMLVTVYKLIS